MPTASHRPEWAGLKTRPQKQPNDIHGRYLKTDPADVALVSPQTPPTILCHPLLAGGYSKDISLDSLLLASFQWVFCVFTCNHPPQQTLHPEPPALPSSQAFREEGPITRCIRRLRSDSSPVPTDIYTICTDVSFISRYLV